MRIAITGFRGIPARYGGFETFAEELAPRLVKKGHEVTVYARSHVIDYKKKYYRGVRIVRLPTIRHKYLDTVAHTFLSVVHSVFQTYDVVLMVNAANSPFALIPRLSGKKVVLNVDGIERMRKKWNWLGKVYYLAGEFLATRLPNRIVSDAMVMRKYYLDKYHKDSKMIPYGATIGSVSSAESLKRFGLGTKKYILYVSRLEPENNAHIVIEAFKLVDTEMKLVILGDAPYADAYKKQLRKIARSDDRIVFTGFVFGKGYKEFQSHAYCYIQATEVGGTHPALVEAMAFGNCVLVNGTPENIEVVGDAGLIYEKNDIGSLRGKLQYLIDHEDICSDLGRRAQERANRKYSWEMVVDEYERLFIETLRKKRATGK
jgi:glycosyltransferase involved in cell wall biosynthesis